MIADALYAVGLQGMPQLPEPELLNRGSNFTEITIWLIRASRGPPCNPWLSGALGLLA